MKKLLKIFLYKIYPKLTKGASVLMDEPATIPLARLLDSDVTTKRRDLPLHSRDERRRTKGPQGNHSREL